MFGRRDDPGQPGLVEPHRPRPAFHGDDRQLGRAGQELVVEQPGQLADRHAEPQRDREQPDERAELGVFEDGPLHVRAVDGGGPVEDDEVDAVLGRGLHGVGHRRDVGVDARPDVLDVEDEDVDPLDHARLRHLARLLGVERAHVLVDVLEHPRFGLEGLPVEAEDGELELLVVVERHVLARLGVPPDAVLGTVEGDEIDGRVRAEQVDRRPQARVRSRGIGDQADPLALDEIEVLFEEDLDPELDPGGRRLRRRLRPLGPGASREDQAQGQDQTEGRRDGQGPLPCHDRREARSSVHGRRSFPSGFVRPLRITARAPASQSGNAP